MVMKKVLIVQNSHEGAGLLSELIKEHSLSQDTVILDKGDPFPSPAGYAALVVLGGSDSANDQTQKMKIELLRIKEALSLGIPYLGICLGLQTLVKAAGGRVIKSPVKEIGFRGPDAAPFRISLTPEGERDALFNGLKGTFPVFQLHGETVELTPSMILLGTGAFCRNQVVRVAPKAYGIQCHFELTQDMFREWTAVDPDLKTMDHELLARDLKDIGTDYLRTGKILFGNFLRIAGLLH